MRSWRSLLVFWWCLSCGGTPSPPPTTAAPRAQCISVWSVQGPIDAEEQDLAIAALAADGDAELISPAAFPGGLTPTDVTWRSRSSAVGRVAPELRSRVGDQRLAWFLIHSGVINTWQHIGSQLCMVEENATDGATAMRFAGVHRTGNAGEVPLAFAVRIDSNGNIRVSTDKPLTAMPLPLPRSRRWRQPLVPRAFRMAEDPPKLLEHQRKRARALPPTHFGPGAPPAKLPGLDLVWEHEPRGQEVVVATRRSIVVHGYNSLVVYRPDDGTPVVTIVDRAQDIEPFKVPPPVYGDPSLFSLGDHYLIDAADVVAFGERDPQPKWRRDTLCGVRPSIRQAKRVGNTIYILDSTTNRSTALAVRLSDGACLWAADTVDYGYPMMLKASADYVAIRSGPELWVHDAAHGAPRFRHRAEKSFGAEPTARGVAVGVVGVGILVLDGNNGAVNTQYADPSLGYGNFEDIAYVGALQTIDDVLFVDAGLDLFALLLGEKKERWRLRHMATLDIHPLGGALYACTDGGYLSAIDPRTGREHWRWGGCRPRGIAYDDNHAPLLIDHSGDRIAAFTAARRRKMESATIEGVVTIDGRAGAGLTVRVGRTSGDKANDDSGASVKTDARGRFSASVRALGVIGVRVGYDEVLKWTGRPRATGTTDAVRLNGAGRYRVNIDARGASEEL